MPLARKLAYLSQATANQWLPRRVIEAQQLRALRRMLGFCEREVPLYRELFQKAGVTAKDVQRIDDLRFFPTVTRERIVGAYPDGVRYRPPRPDDVVFRTSGTSGLFMEIAYSADANDWLDAVYARSLFATGYKPWHRFAYFWWEAEDKPKRSYEKLGLMKKAFLPLDPDPRVQLAALRRIEPAYIYNFPSVMMMLARIVDAEGLGNLAPRGIICHGEFMPKEIQNEISRVFRCPVYNQYGAQEFNRMAWDCSEHGALHIDADSVLIEVMDGDRTLDPGEEGELVVTGLVNRLMPLVRYRIGDAGKRVAGSCPCGRGLPLLEITEGRMDDVLTLPDGRRIGPRVIAPRIEALTGFTQYRVVQKTPDRVEVLVVWDRDAPADGPQRVETVAREALGAGVNVSVRGVESIPLNRRGKLRKVVSEVRA
jgi:phenylacetate-CoA ligase